MKVRRILNTGVQEQESEQTVEEEQQLKADSKIRVRRVLEQQQQPTTATDQVAVTEVPEITDELPEGPLSQSELHSYYQEKLPQMFDSEGRLVAPELGRDLGYVFEESLVPTGSRIMGEDVHESTAGTMFRYNQPQAAVEQQQNIARSGLSRTERGALERAEDRQTLEEAAEASGKDLSTFIEEDVIASIDENEMPYMKGFLEATGSWGFNTLMAVGNAAEWTSEAYGDTVQGLAEALQDASPDAYDTVVKTITGTKQSPEQFAKGATREAGNMLTFSETVPVLGAPAKLSKVSAGSAKAAKELADAIKKQQAAATKSAKKAAGKQVAQAKANLSKKIDAEIVEADKIAAKKQAKADKKREAILGKRMRIGRAKEATAAEIAKKAEEAKKVADVNKSIREDLIVIFEEDTGKSISRVADDGSRVLDFDKARVAGKETLEEVSELEKVSKVRDFLAGATPNQTEASLLAGMGDTITQPVLQPDKLDGLVAVVADLKQAYPEAFKPKKHASGPRKGQDYRVIDHLFELTVEKELIAGDELLDTLNKYNLSFEDYILTVVGSGSEAGKTLQKLSQIKRMKPANAQIAAQERATKENAGVIRKFVMRVENIRRGGLVSQVATAARNLTSGAIRAPMEGLGNVMDTALYNLSEEGAGAAAKSLLSPAQWKDSFRHMKYMFGPETRLDVQDYTDFILEQPELADQFDLMFNNINEIQKMTGRGEGGVIDSTLSLLEDGVDVLNTPNRWQEYLIRRGAFLGELERLTKREYGIDLIDTVNEGKIRDLLNDASNVRPANARSFHDLVADATNRALDITYAKQPEIPVFRSTSQFIVRNGLTVIAPFPRFMFNSMELMGQYAGGASIPLARKMASLVTMGKVGKGPITAKDRQRISRNIIGLATVGAAYQYRTSEDAPADYKLMNTMDNTVMDTTPQYPMRQFLYMGEAMKRMQDGTFGDWFKAKEFADTFIGVNIREGVGQSLIQEVADLASGVDLTDEEQAGRLLGRSLGNYLSTWAVPYAQVIEAERALGMRGLEYKDTAEDPTLDFQTTFMQNLSRPFARLESPEEEEARPEREFLFAEDKQRVAPILRVLGGINLSTADEEYGEYISSFGFTDYELGSKSKVPSIRSYENKIVRNVLPVIVDSAKAYEERLRRDYANASDETRELVSEDKYVSSRLRMFLKTKITSVREKAGKGKVLSAESPTYTQFMMDYRRLSKDARSAAGIKFIDKYGREPDPLDEKDLARLVKIGKGYKKAMK